MPVVKIRQQTKFWDMRRDGITQSLIQCWQGCPEKARLCFQKGLRRDIPLSHALDFGSLVHDTLEKHYTHPDVDIVRQIEVDLGAEIGVDLEEREVMLGLAEAVLEGYVKHWGPSDESIQWEHLEYKFKEAFPLGDEHIYLRGKFDGVFRSGGGLWLFETKTKGRIEENSLIDSLPFEIQVRLYIWALWKRYKEIPKGVLYNVIRRPQLKRKQKETIRDFVKRVREDIVARPEFYYMRFEVAITPEEVEATEEMIRGILTAIDLWEKGAFHFMTTGSCNGKFGVCEYLPICGRSDHTGFIRRGQVFPELDGDTDVAKEIASTVKNALESLKGG